MSKSVHPLDNISIAKPCSVDWDSMDGNDVVRFCHHCRLNVHDLSLMTREEALSLVRNSEGRLCLRYVWRPDGTIQTAPPFQKLHLIKRRATKLVAGAFGATLSLCAAAAAQTPAQADVPEAVCEVPLKAKNSSSQSEGGVASLAGTVFDPANAVIPGARVILVNTATKNQMSTETDNKGRYRFQNLLGGSYAIIVETPGFARSEITDVDVSATGERLWNVTLQIAMLSGDIVMAGPSEPLVAAVVEENEAAIRELLDAGADVNVLDKGWDTTPLQQAVMRGNVEIAELLLQQRADVSLKNRRGQMAILNLSERGTGELVRRLVYAGANINEKDNDGNTPLILTAALGKAEILRAVLEAGASPNDQNKRGQTALMIAAREGRMENVRALLAAGANSMLEDEEGWTALKYARENAHYDVAELLEAYGAVK